MEDIQAMVDWYRRIPEEVKRDVAFRYERAEDKSAADLYHALAAAKRLSKMWEQKKAST